MRLGSQTASVINHLKARATIGQPDPVPGMGATVLHWTDRSPATVFRVFSHKGYLAIEVRDDDYKLVSGSTLSESQGYEFKTNVRGSRRFFVFKGGVWREAHHKVTGYDEDGEPIRAKSLSLYGGNAGRGLLLGDRDRYCDPSF